MNFRDGIANTAIPTTNWYTNDYLATVHLQMLIEGGGAGYIAVHGRSGQHPGGQPGFTPRCCTAVSEPPPKCPVKVHITAQHPVTEGRNSILKSRDEHYQMEGEWDKTNVLAMTQSEHGQQVGVWAHECGNARVRASPPAIPPRC